MIRAMSETEIYKSETLEHLGLVAGMFDELGIGELVDEMVPQDLFQRKISVGQALKAMVLNGLGFANRRLYLMPEFFRNKPTERLVGAGISPEHLNDEALGKALDALYAFGLTELYRLIARRAAERLGLGSGGWQWRTWIPPASTWTGATTATWMISTKRRGAHPREQGLQPGS